MDQGLLQGLIQGLQSGVESYQNQKKITQKDKEQEAERKRQQQMVDIEMKKSGFLLDPGTGQLIESPEHKEQKELDKQYKKAQTGHMQAETAELSGGKIKPDQAAAALFAKRMQQAEQDFSDLEKGGYNRASGKEGFLSSWAPGFIQPENLKRQEQAEQNFVNAILRRESGAAIAKSEYEGAEKQYFPRPGDTEKVKEQKRLNRALAFEGLKGASGKAFDKIPGPDEIKRAYAKQGGSLLDSRKSVAAPAGSLEEMSNEELKAYINGK